MPVLSTGTPMSQNIVFNSGTFDINGQELVVLQDITITTSWSNKEIRQIGSLKMVGAPKRCTFKAGAKAKVKTINKELIAMMAGSSGPDGTGTMISVFDGQNVLTRCSIKCIANEDPTKVIEFQFTNSILSGSLGIGLKMEDAAESDFEITAQDVNIFFA